MSRGIGLESDLATSLEVVEPLLALVTQLGDTWFIVALGLALYWLGVDAPLDKFDRRLGLLVLAVALWAIAATFLLKVVLALPRPPGAAEPAYAVSGPIGLVYTDAATATGYGFPSGHATGAAAVYGTLAWVGGESGRHRRLGAAAGVIALVGLTRVALGLHYVVDVLAGAALGLTIAAVAIRFVRRPGVVLGLAAATAGGRALAEPVGPQTAALLGMTVGALAAWAWLGPGGRLRDDVATSLQVGLAAGTALLVALGLARHGIVLVGVALIALGGGLLVVGLPSALRAPET